MNHQVRTYKINSKFCHFFNALGVLIVFHGRYNLGLLTVVGVGPKLPYIPLYECAVTLLGLFRLNGGVDRAGIPWSYKTHYFYEDLLSTTGRL